MPPTGKTSPRWFKAPVTAIACASGTLAKLDNKAYNSAHEAESPSTPLYSCSKTTAAFMANGAMCANSEDR